MHVHTHVGGFVTNACSKTHQLLLESVAVCLRTALHARRLLSPLSPVCFTAYVPNDDSNTHEIKQHTL
jgi:hypothetical protein